LLENLCFTRFLHENLADAQSYNCAGDPEAAQPGANSISYSISGINNSNTSGDVDRCPAIFNFYA
jgi:hypothetical protein